MKIDFGGDSHLSYCTNVHPGETLDEVCNNIIKYVVPIKQIVCPDKPFGIGLRLSQQASLELLESTKREKFLDICQKHALYVFTINGFIHGHFHDKPVKENVYLPDWTQQERLEFTNHLAQILALILPEDIKEGTISTVPGAFKSRITNDNDIQQMVHHLLLHIAELCTIKRFTGKDIVLCLEPEPGCFLETIEETISFFCDRMFHKNSVQKLQKYTGLSQIESEDFLKKHIAICYDTCHMAIEREDAKSALEQLAKNEILVAKIQISSAPKIIFTSKDTATQKYLSHFSEEIYLHQVVQSKNGKLERFNDLPIALEALQHLPENVDMEWCIHFHVPIFLENIPPFATTQQHIIDTLNFMKNKNICKHYEVETYTWGVLPKKYQCEDIVTAISREMIWCKEKMNNNEK